MKEQICSIEEGDTGWPSDNLQEFILWLKNKLSEVPEDQRDSATISMSGFSWFEYGECPKPIIEIHTIAGAEGRPRPPQ